MILWSSEELEQALASGQLDSWTKVKYIMIPTVLGSLSTPFYVLRPVYGERAPVIQDLFSFAFNIAAACITYWGLKRCFIANNEIDGKAFFERAAVLSVPIFIRIVVFTILGSMALLLALSQLKKHFPVQFRGVSILFAVFNPIIAYAMFAMLTNSIRRFGSLIKVREAQSL